MIDPENRSNARVDFFLRHEPIDAACGHDRCAVKSRVREVQNFPLPFAESRTPKEWIRKYTSIY